MARRGPMVLAMLFITGCGGLAQAPSPDPTPTPRSTSRPSPSPSPSPSQPALPLAHVDGWIAYNIGTSSRSVVRLVRPDGSENHAIGEDAGPRSNHPDWLPDGRRLLFAQTRTPDDAGSVWMWDLTAESSTEVVPCTGSCLGRQNASPSSDGSRLVYETNDGPLEDVVVGTQTVPIPARCGLQTIALATKETHDVVSGPCGIVEWRYPRWSPGGDLTYFRTTQAQRGGPVARTELIVRDAATGKETVIADWPHWDEWSQLDWSPDGDWIAFTLDGRLDRMRPDGTGRETVVDADATMPDAHFYHPRFLRDGQSITYNRALAPGGLITSVRLFVVPVAGGSAAEVLPEGPNGTDAHYNWGSLQPPP